MVIMSMRYRTILPFFLSLCLIAILAPFSLAAKKTVMKGIGEFEIPDWFKVSFLDIRGDIKEAKSHNKRLIVYFGQKGCPYCAALFNNNFSQRHILEYTRKHFDAVAINMWGDREVTAYSGKTYTEKTFAKFMQIWYTPTLLFFDERGQIVLRLNGYYPPHKFTTALHYVAERQEKKMNFAQYMASVDPKPAKGIMHKEPFFLGPPYNLAKYKNKKPLAVFFEQKDCSPCDTLHGTILHKQITRALIRRFNVVQLDKWSNVDVITPMGEKTTAKTWARKLNIAYAPSVVFFVKGKEVMRMEAFLKTFHFQSVLDYVSTGAYRKQPSFQRYLQGRADHLRKQGVVIDLWK